MMAQAIKTPVTEMLGMRHPVLLAGMNQAAGPELAAAVSNAGGLGVVGGVMMSPKMLRTMIKSLKKDLTDPNLPFGVDLLLPKVGEGARSTNYDYTGGQLGELIDVIISEKAKLFVSAVGVPPKEVVERLHKAGIPIMNMIGSPKHVQYALAAGVDIICAQGGEGGGHTGDVATSILIPMVVDLVKGHKSPLFGTQVQVVAAGGIYDGRGLAAMLSFGAGAVWVGTRFVASEEAAAPNRHKQACVKASVHDTHRTLVFTGRPLRIIKNPYSELWENDRQDVMKEALSKGIIPYKVDAMGIDLSKIPVGGLPNKHEEEHAEVDLPDDKDGKTMASMRPLLIGQVCGAINDIKPAKVILESMVTEAVQVMRFNQSLLVSKL